MKSKFSRRDFLRGIGAGIAGITAAGIPVSEVLSRRAEASEEAKIHELLMRGTENFKGLMAKEITPNDEFYITSYSSSVPDVDEKDYTLSIEGLVDRPIKMSMKDVTAMKDKTEFVTLECIGNPIGGDAISNALWEGVTLHKILDMAIPRKGVVKTVFYALDDYSDSIPYELSRSDDVFLAFRMNGEPLPKVHGYPLRAIVPGIYGMKNVKWLTRIELSAHNYKGYWEKRGWSDEAVIQINSQILMPMDGKRVPSGPFVVGGIAYAGKYGISKVQVSFDDGKVWHDAEMKEPLSRWAWVLWRYEWSPPKDGRYTITVRGFDRSGKVQEKGSMFSGTFPDGARGYHSIDITVGG